MSTPAPDQEPTVRIDTDAKPLSRPRKDDAQFAPGTLVAGRYRIAGLLGSGGMGEVYRADDTRLDQQVALKFLPARLSRDTTLLARLHEEVRLGRQVAHPNVCRIYDLVESDGAYFIAMEHVDGEDLGRLLRRIGRLAHDKAVEIARGIAAGLGAAHAKGILHRDLKPANVMIDSHGHARIMDFGLALGAGEDDGTISGTPAYMAPEQLDGQPATIQSDLYALGLVMYELFTGKRVHEARTLPDRVRGIGAEIATPSSHIRDLDAAVERTILRCLAHDPAARPRSAREVVAAMPGGDPLAAALSAGETPSPGLIAAAGSEGTLSRRAAWSLLATIAALIAITILCLHHLAPSNVVPMERSPEVLRQRASEQLRSLGVVVEGEPIAAFYDTPGQITWLSARGGQWWETFRRGPAPHHYRLEYGMRADQSRVVPMDVSAPKWTSADIDPQGRLIYLIAPPKTNANPRPLDWKPLLAAAGLDPAALRPAVPRHAPVVSFDARGAWSGTYPGDTTPLRIETAAWQGTPVYLRVAGPWDDAPPAPAPASGFGGRGVMFFTRALYFSVFTAGFLLALRNLRMRRGDRQGALRVAGALLIVHVVRLALLQPWHASGANWQGELARIAGEALFDAALFYLLYIALEPYARRRWPELLIAWARLVAGRARDPLVGHHLLIGLAAGAAHAALSLGSRITSVWLGGPETGVFILSASMLNGVRSTMANVLMRTVDGLSQGFLMMMLLVLLTIILRKRALAAASVFVVMALFFGLAVGSEPAVIPNYVVIAALFALVITRFGLLATTAMHATFGILFSMLPPTGPAWMVQLAWIPLVVLAAATLWAFRTSLGGQPAFAANVLDD